MKHSQQHKFDHKQSMPYPTHHTVGFFNSAEDVEALLEDLEDHGVLDNAIDVFAGEEDRQSIDLHGDDHWILGKLIRLSQRFFDTGEWSLYKIADEELKLGHALVTVSTKTEDQKDHVANVMLRHHGHDIKYFNPLYVEHVSKERGDITRD